MADKEQKPLSLVDHILQIAASLRGKPLPSPIDDPSAPRIGLGITRAQRAYAIDKYVEDANRGSK